MKRFLCWGKEYIDPDGRGVDLTRGRGRGKGKEGKFTSRISLQEYRRRVSRAGIAPLLCLSMVLCANIIGMKDRDNESVIGYGKFLFALRSKHVNMIFQEMT